MTDNTRAILNPITRQHAVQVVRRGHGLDIGDLTQDHYAEMQRHLPNGATVPITLGVFYDLPPDPKNLIQIRLMSIAEDMTFMLMPL